jgi:hypothetical protein
MLKFLQSVANWFSRLFGRPPEPQPPRREIFRTVLFVEGDELPAELPPMRVVVAREGRTLWSAGMACPCGCGRRLEVMLLDSVKPRWDLSVDEKDRPTLHPSVWVADGCRSHFILRKGMIEWCD